MAHITVSNLCKNYGDKSILDEVSFAVPAKQITACLGINGAGKTTLMDILCGVRGADAGTILLGGFDLHQDPLRAKAVLGYVPESLPFPLDLRVEEALLFAAEIRQVSAAQRKTRLAYIYDILDLGKLRDVALGKLSRGLQQRVSLGQALIHDPQVLILDEPTNGMDPVQMQVMLELLTELAKEKCIFLSSHLLGSLSSLCSHYMFLHEGKIRYEGTYAQLVQAAHSQGCLHIKIRREPVKFLALMQGYSWLHHQEVQTVTTAVTHQSEYAFTFVLDRDHNAEEFAVQQDALEVLCRLLAAENFGLLAFYTQESSLESVFLGLLQD